MKSNNDIPEIFPCIRKAFEYVKVEVEQNDQQIMDCMLSIFADDMQNKIQYHLLKLDFHAEVEWNTEDEEILFCNIDSIYIPLHLTQKGKDLYEPLFEMWAATKPEWLEDSEVEIKWLEPYETKTGMGFPVTVFLRNATPEQASRFVSLMAALALPEGEDMEVWCELNQEFENGEEPVCEFGPDNDEDDAYVMKYRDEEQFTLGDTEVTGKKILEKFEPDHIAVYHIDAADALAFSDMGTDICDIQKEFPDWAPQPGSYADMFLMYRNHVPCVAGLEEVYNDLEDPDADIPVTPDMNLCAHSPEEYVDFWKSNKDLPQIP